MELLQRSFHQAPPTLLQMCPAQTGHWTRCLRDKKHRNSILSAHSWVQISSINLLPLAVLHQRWILFQEPKSCRVQHEQQEVHLWPYLINLSTAIWLCQKRKDHPALLQKIFAKYVTKEGMKVAWIWKHFPCHLIAWMLVPVTIFVPANTYKLPPSPVKPW